MEYVEGSTLQEAWDQMSSKNQQSIVAELVGALRHLHTLRLSDGRVQALLRQALNEMLAEGFQDAVIGGPGIGFLRDGSALLGAVSKKMGLKRPFHTAEATTCPDGIVLRSHYEDLGPVKLESSTMAQWGHEAVFCHNDLTPRNIMVQLFNNTDGTSTYKLNAIIDWELAGFYPASYELSLQDTYLSGGNWLISYYLLLKRQMKDLVPSSSSQVSLLRAMELLFESRQRRLAECSNIPAHIRKRFIERLQLRRDEDPYIG
ncbi:uncharacterized protein CTRU02_207966 [Colletotrichum truncatum]|uniref:Uncharacterized protein n=1 Tax=Colletotrichum truncatum TaxID=5467 RepID=A0ACC3Z2M9_COLTU|nr:uncharacterized protein CTRU02_11008 [Colletotrichum truncatum]KAF6786510.1 hypothetical protein CTRU02_11008 [Colletotrichum truncatum]